MPSHRYRPEIDGLRAIAVLAVVLFHARLPAFKGGFVGVDVFFVISGYLITGLILNQPTVDLAYLKTFYERRVRRLFPPLIPVLLFTTAMAYWQLTPDAMREYSESLIAFLLFSSNWFFLHIAGYFDGPSELKPLLHTWSLSVEEQFYLIFPAGILLIKRYGKPDLVGRFILAVFVISLAFQLSLISSKSVNSAFFHSFGRFWEIALGALIACGVLRLPKGAIAAEAAALLGVTLIALCAVLGRPSNAIVWIALAAGGTALVIMANNSTTGRLLASPPLVGIGLVSYGFYLWHWPLFAFLSVTYGQQATARHFAVAGLLAFVLAVASYVVIERPVRFKRIVSGRQLLAGFAAAMVAFISFGFAGVTTNGFEMRASLLARNYEKSLQESIWRQRAAALRDQCWLPGVNDGEFSEVLKRCVQPRQGRPRMLLVGDSHAAQFIDALRQRLGHVDVHLLAVDGCTLTGGFDDANRPTCMSIIRYLDNLRPDEFDVVTMVTQAPVFRQQEAAQNYLERVSGLTEKSQVYVYGPIQYYAPDMPTIYKSIVGSEPNEIARRFDRALDPEKFELDNRMREALRGVPRAKFISLLSVACPKMRCRHLDAGGWPVLVDQTHMSREASHELIDQIADQIEVRSAGLRAGGGRPE